MINFQFVHVDASSAKARKRNHQLARAHSARTHRRDQHDELIDIAVCDPSERTLVIVKAPQDVKPRAVRSIQKSVVITAASSPAAPFTPQLASRADSLPDHLASPPPAKTISPVFGALAPKTFDPGSSLKSGQVAHYLMSVIFHNRLTHEHAMQRFQTFCEEPMMHHVLSYCVAIYHDQVNESLALSRQPEMLWHKAEAIRLLNASLPHVDDSNLDLVICTVMYLTGLDLDKRQSNYPLLIQGHPWPAMWPWVDGQKPPVREHVDALQMLVRKRGGLEALQMPGLPLSIARSDLVNASLMLERPRFECYWALDEDAISAYQEIQLSAPQVPGYGLTSIAGILPFELFDVLVNIATTERLLRNHLNVFSLNEKQLESARCIAHHQVLSLPAWEATDGIYSEWADETVYECCRLTGILYSNAVILGLPPHIGWHVRLCAQIRSHLQDCDMEELSGDAPGLLIWILTVGCMAAFGSEHQEFFERELRSAVDREGLESRQSIEQVLEGFLWSAETCGDGANFVWETLEMV